MVTNHYCTGWTQAEALNPPVLALLSELPMALEQHSFIERCVSGTFWTAVAAAIICVWYVVTYAAFSTWYAVGCMCLIGTME